MVYYLKLFLFLCFSFKHFFCWQYHFQKEDVLPSRLIFTQTSSSLFQKTQFYLESCPFVTYLSLQNPSQANLSQLAIIPMSLSLSTKAHFVVAPNAKGCGFFKPYESSKRFEHKKLNVKKTIGYPFTKIEGELVNANLYSGSQNIHSSKIELLFAKKCTNNKKASISSTKASGYIGLAKESSSQDYLKELNSFSLYVSPEGMNAELIYGLDKTKIVNHDNVITLVANSEWEAQIELPIYLEDKILTNFQGTVVFNINSCFIGLPTKIFNSFMKELSKQGFNCNIAENIPYACTYSGDFTKLPNMILFLANKSNKLMVSPKSYLSLTGDATFSLMIAPSSHGNHKKSLYEEYLILGAPFFKEHYLYFDGNKEKGIITIYETNVTNEPVQSESFINQYILLGIVISGMIGLLLVLNACKLSNNPHVNQEETLLSKTQLTVGKEGKVVKPSKFSKEHENTNLEENNNSENP